MSDQSNGKNPTRYTHLDTSLWMPSRRDFGLGLAALAGASLISNPVRQAHAQTPLRGGKVRVAMNSQSTNDTLDPARFIYSNDYVRGSMFYNCLARMGEDNEPKPELAESWEANDTATQWVVTLRKGVEFHDGSSLTSDDVIYSLLRHKDEKVTSTARSLAANISDIKADGTDKVIIELASPDAGLPALLATFQFAIIKAGTTTFTTVNGTGPFLLKEFVPGVRTIGERNGSYWKEGRPYVDEIEMFSIVDAVARLNALLSGDVHMISEVRGAGIDELARSESAEIFSTPCPRFTDIVMRVDQEPTINSDFRLMIANLVDRQRYLDIVLKGRGQLGNDHPILPTSPLYNSELKQRELDLDQAKFHFAKTGIGQTRVPLHVGDAAVFSTDLGQILQRDASRIGLNIDLRREPPDSYWNSVWGKRPLTAGNFQPRPYALFLTLAFKTGAGLNASGTSIPRLDAAIDEARGALDPAKRKEVYDEIQDILYNHVATVLPAFPDIIDGISKKVKGLKPIPVGALGGFAFADQIWLEA